MNSEKPFLTGKYTIPPPQIQIDDDSPDGRVFHFDDAEFSVYRKNYRSVREENLSKCYGMTSEYRVLESCVTKYMMDRLVYDCPDAFAMETNNSESILACPIADERLVFDSTYSLQESSVPYESALDAIVSLLQEDVAVVKVEENGRNTLAAAHVTAPNYWGPAEILGKSLADIHRVVPGMPRIGSNWVSRLAEEGNRVVQYQWGITTDDRLNHHPDKPPNSSLSDGEWHGRKFNPDHPTLFVRVERQTFVGFGNCFLFAIRTYFHDCETFTTDERHALADGIRSMGEEKREYKGLANAQNDAICTWLTS
jgi:hypothetical protein